MVDQPTELDEYRSHVAQAATESRRLTNEVQADQAELTERQAQLEQHLFASAAGSWPEAVEKARYLLTALANRPGAEDPRFRMMVADVLGDFDRLLGAERPVAENDPF